MTHQAKALSAGSTQAGGSARGLIRRALVTRAARNGSDGSGAPSSRRAPVALIAVLAVVASLAFTAAPAAAAPPTPTMGTISDVSYSSATVTGKVHSPGGFALWEFQYSTDQTVWTGGGSGFVFAKPEEQAVGPVKITGLKGDTHYFVRLRATNFIEEKITVAPHPDFTTLHVDPPVIAATDDASAVFSTSATATGTVKRPANTDPAFDVKCRFEYVTHADFTATGYSKATARDCQPNPIGPADADTNKAVSAPLGCPNPVIEDPEGKCLKPGTTYHLRMVTENASPTVVTKEATNTFTAAAPVAKPTVIGTNKATDLIGQTAKVSGEIERPAGADPALNTGCRFEYVKDVDFQATGWAKAGRTPCAEAPAENPVKTTGPTPVTAELTGLKTTTVYHWRLTAENGGGSVSKDAAETFTTFTQIDPTFTVNPIDPGDIGYNSVHVTGVIDNGTPERGLTIGWQFSTDPNAPFDDWDGLGLCCTAVGHNTEYSWTFGPTTYPYKAAPYEHLTPGTKYYVRLVGYDYTEDPYFIIEPPGPYESFTTKGTSTPPTVDLDPVTTFTSTTAHISGTVDTKAPAGPLTAEGKAAYDTHWHIECEPECKDVNENMIKGMVEAEEGAQPIAGDIVRLAPNTKYDVTLIATNVLGTFETPLEPFTTVMIKPTVKSAEGASDGKGGYTIQGVVNPNNSKVTDCKFEWGPTAPDYAFEATCSPMPGGRNEIQNVFLRGPLNGTGVAPVIEGQFKLTFRGETTPDLPYNATAPEVESALKALSTIGPNDVDVVPGPGFGGHEWKVTFEGSMAETDVPQIKGKSGTLPLGSSVGEGGGPGNGSVDWLTVRHGGNSQPVVVEAHLPGLTPGAVYHFNLVATNAAGTSQSGDTEFVPTIITPEVCSNEQFRKESSSLALPECRAYEMVTPPGKEGFPAALTKLATGSFGDERIVFNSKAGNLAKSGQNSAFGNSYVSERSAAGWSTIPNLNGPAGTLKEAPSLVISFVGAGTPIYSDDLLTSVWPIRRQDGVGGAWSNGVDGINFYLRRQDGTFALIGPSDGTAGKHYEEDGLAFSGDLTHVVRWVTPNPLFGASLWGPGVYETVGTGWEGPPLRVDLDNSGNPISNCTGVANSSGKSVSRDGRVIVFRVTGGCGGPNPPADELWARVGGTTAFDVSATQCTRVAPACNVPSAPEFVSTAADGSRVIFTTSQQLVNGDIDQTQDIYACDIPSGNPTPAGKANHCTALRRVSVAESGSAKVENVFRTSEDGSSILFMAEGVLADNEDSLGGQAVAGDRNFYVWRSDAAHPNGQTTFVARLNPVDIERPQITPDGRYLVFTSANQLLDTDTDTARDVYRYDVEGGKLNRVSTNVVGVAGNGDGFEATIPPVNAISDDGTKIIFETREGLSPADGNAEPDVYLWTPDQVSLISTGSVGAGGTLGAVSPSGKSVYFHTSGALSPADGDDLADVYNARSGGGFSFASPAPCAGEACQPAASGSPPAPAPATTQPPADPGNVKLRTCPKGKVLKGDKCVKKKKGNKKKGNKKKKAGHKRGGSK